MTTFEQLPVAEDLFRSSGDAPALVGTRCTGCGTHYFPKSLSCRNPRCDAKAVEEVLLGRRGRLHSYTVQHYRPPALFRMEPCVDGGERGVRGDRGPGRPAHAQGVHPAPARDPGRHHRHGLPALGRHGGDQPGVLGARSPPSDADFGTTAETFAQASVLMHGNAAANPLARYRTACTVEDVLGSPLVSDPLHLLEICAVSDGAAAVVLGSEEQARRLGVPLVRVAGSAVATGQFGDPAVRIPTESMNADASVQHTSEVGGAVTAALEAAGLGTGDVDFLELADNSAWHVLAWPELFGFLEPGQSDWMIERGELGVEGKLPVNPSGGFLSFGEATTAQGVLQVCELVWQLRQQAQGRQVPGARVGMSAVLGLGANGASVVLTA